MTETILANAQLILADGVQRGAIVIAGDQITQIDTGTAVPAGAVDCQGDYVAPGLVELHTDNLERHLRPRPGVNWPYRAAILAHDRELAACGITTVFDAIRVGSIPSDTRRRYTKYAREMADEIAAAEATGALKIGHRLHVRAEICSETLLAELEEFGPRDRVGILSLMDHTPGQRQFSDLAKFEDYVCGKHGVSRDGFGDYCDFLRGLQAKYGAAHEIGAVQAAARLGAVLASHDDTTPEQVATSSAYDVRLAEFPTTLQAAQACHQAGIAVMMGAPNYVRGASHSGNVAASDLADAGLLDILSSDYVPAALLLSAVQLGLARGDLAAGLATVTAAPARAAGLPDRGRLAPGLRADLIRFRIDDGLPVLQSTWCRGARVA